MVGSLTLVILSSHPHVGIHVVSVCRRNAPAECRYCFGDAGLSGGPVGNRRATSHLWFPFCVDSTLQVHFLAIARSVVHRSVSWFFLFCVPVCNCNGLCECSNVIDGSVDRVRLKASRSRVRGHCLRLSVFVAVHMVFAL